MKLYNPIFEKSNPQPIKEAINVSALNKVLRNIRSLLNKRGIKLIGQYDVYDVVKKPSDTYIGFKYYIGKTGKAVRFNWSRSESTELNSIDFFYRFKPTPSYTMNVEGLNLVQIVDVLTEYLKRPAKQVTVEMKEADGILSRITGRKTVEVKKAEVERPLIKPSTEAEAKKVVFRGLTSEEIFQRIKSGVERILDPSSGDNLLIVAGDPGVGKTIEIERALKAGGTGPIIPPLFSVPVKDIQKKSKSQGETDQPEESLQSKLNKIAMWSPSFEPKYIQGSADVSSEELFIELFRSNGKILFYDDSDSVITDKKCIGLLKNALQSKEKRLLTYGSKAPYLLISKEVGAIPKTFTYTGKIIVATNRPLKSLDSALQSRSGGLVIEVDLNAKQILNRLRSIIPAIQKSETPNIPVQVYYECWDWLYDLMINKKALTKFDFRTFVHGLVKERYRVSDVSMWEAIAANVIVAKYPKANIVIQVADE